MTNLQHRPQLTDLADGPKRSLERLSLSSSSEPSPAAASRNQNSRTGELNYLSCANRRIVSCRLHVGTWNHIRFRQHGRYSSLGYLKPQHLPAQVVSFTLALSAPGCLTNPAFAVEAVVIRLGSEILGKGRAHLSAEINTKLKTIELPRPLHHAPAAKISTQMDQIPY